MYCPQCGELIAETIINTEVSLGLHKLFKHNPEAATVLGVIASVALSVGIKKLFD